MGPSGPLLAIDIGHWPHLKLHAVAPGGPPEGQCKKEEKALLHDFRQLLPYGVSTPTAPSCAFLTSSWTWLRSMMRRTSRLSRDQHVFDLIRRLLSLLGRSPAPLMHAVELRIDNLPSLVGMIGDSSIASFGDQLRSLEGWKHHGPSRP